MKKITVKDVLNLIDENTPVCVTLYAYGVYYGNTASDGMRSAKDCKEQMNTSCLNALVGEINTRNPSIPNQVHISAELVH